MTVDALLPLGEEPSRNLLHLHLKSKSAFATGSSYERTKTFLGDME